MQWCIVVAVAITLAISPGKSYSDSMVCITLNEALSIATKSNPQLKSARLAVDAQRALIKQSALFSNPEVEVNLENFGQNEIEAGISQTIELWGKRSFRILIAKKEAEKAAIEYEKAKRELAADVTFRFADILTWQEKLKQLEHIIAVSESSLAITKHQVQIGAAKEIDVIRTEMELSSLMIEKRSIQRSRDQSIKHIKSLLGPNAGNVQGVSGWFDLDFTVPSFSELETAIASNPDFLLQTKMLELSELKIRKARAEYFPDLTIGAGYLYNNETNENTAVVGISFELPLFNRNQGVIVEKRLKQQASRHDMENLKNIFHANLFEMHSEFLGLKEQHALLKKQILPKAERSYGQLLNFYQTGKSGFRDVLAFRKELIELHMNIIETKVEIVKMAVEIELKTNIKLSTIK